MVVEGGPEARSCFERRALVAIFAGAIAVRLVIAWAPVEWLVRTVLGDDPFYYFTIARHLAHGQGATFDGVEPTNGFHPLWMAAILPIFLPALQRAHDGVLAIHLTLTLAAAFDLVALFFLHRLLREAGVGVGVSLAGAALYCVSPLLLAPAGPLNGMETALNLALTFAFLTLYRRRVASDSGGAYRASAMVWLGLCAGLLFLARTDNVFVLLFCFGFLVWRHRGEPARLGRDLGAVLIAVGVAAPWLVWSRVTFGSFVQVSGLSIAHVTRVLAHANDWTIAERATKLARNLCTLATYFPVYHLNVGSFATAATGNLLVVLAIGGTAAACLRTDTRGRRRVLRARLAPWIPPLVAGAIFVLVHTVRAIELRGWYYVSILPASYVALGLVADYLIGVIGPAPRRTKQLLAASLAAGMTVMVALSLRAGLSHRCGESDAYRMIREANRALPDGTRLGSWNAGLFGYFYERGEVVNLDGLVNNAAYGSIMTSSLGAYVTRRRIGYLLDATGAMDLSTPFWNHGRAVTFPRAILDNHSVAECREMRVVPVPLKI